MDRSVAEGCNESIELFVKNGIRFQIVSDDFDIYSDEKSIEGMMYLITRYIHF